MNDRAILEGAARALIDWVRWHHRMRQIVLRPWALIDGQRADVVYHRPGDLR